MSSMMRSFVAIECTRNKGAYPEWKVGATQPRGRWSQHPRLKSTADAGKEARMVSVMKISFHMSGSMDAGVDILGCCA